MFRAGFQKGWPVAHWHSIDTLNAGPVAPQAAPASGAWPTANLAIFVPLLVRQRVTIKKLWFGSGSTGTGNVDIGVYDVGGTRLVSSGSQAKGASTTEQVYDCTDTVIDPGLFYFALASDSATDTYFRLSLTTPTADAYGIWDEASAFALPASATFTTGATIMPVGGILTNTVVS